MIFGGIVVAEIVSGGMWLSQDAVRPLNPAAHRAYHECENLRDGLEEALYRYALDKGLTNTPDVIIENLLPYMNNPRPVTCLGGGTYAVDPVTHGVTCSLQEHMFDSCLSRTTTLQTNRWNFEYPLDYRGRDQWRCDTQQTDAGLVLRLSGVTILFKDLHPWGIGTRLITVSGSSSGHGSSGLGDKVVTHSYAKGVFTLSIAGHVMRFTEGGIKMEVNSKRFDLAQIRPTVIVEADGDAQLGEPGGIRR